MNPYFPVSKKIIQKRQVHLGLLLFHYSIVLNQFSDVSGYNNTNLRHSVCNTPNELYPFSLSSVTSILQRATT